MISNLLHKAADMAAKAEAKVPQLISGVADRLPRRKSEVDKDIDAIHRLREELEALREELNR